MILKNEDALKRLASPLNLMNKKNNGLSLFTGNKSNNEKKMLNFAAPIFNKSEVVEAEKVEKVEEKVEEREEKNLAVRTDDLVDNADTKIQLAAAHDKALGVLTQAIDALASKMDDVPAAKLPAIITAASKVVADIRKERNEHSKNNKGNTVNYNFYTPTQKQISDYEIVEVGG